MCPILGEGQKEEIATGVGVWSKLRWVKGIRWRFRYAGKKPPAPAWARFWQICTHEGANPGFSLRKSMQNADLYYVSGIRRCPCQLKSPKQGGRGGEVYVSRFSRLLPAPAQLLKAPTRLLPGS